MAKKTAHTDFRLFEYLNGALDERAAQVIESHLSECHECGALATLVRGLKERVLEQQRLRISQTSSQTSQVSGEHPDIGELAAFFYAKPRHAPSSKVAAHLAICTSCCQEIAQYAAGEHAAVQYRAMSEAAAQVPTKAWEMIHDWEDSGFARLKPASEVLSNDLLTRLTRILYGQSQDFPEIARPASQPGSVDLTEGAERVPVLVVSRSGEVRSVEIFEEVVESSGTRILRHPEGSRRFDNRLVYALLDLGEKEPLVISELIASDILRLEHAPRAEERLRRVDYLIVEDNKE